ncbi:unnamed protein product [marine sediment metagenome]|uniref:Uncharacterized protein n=1 Tax=marine sediment metagenome TaxID=412755 RepID=X1D1Y5_9ZZZZ
MGKNKVKGNTKKTCKGLYWKMDHSYNIPSYKKIELTKSLELIEEKSCPGCKQCQWLHSIIDDLVMEEHTHSIGLDDMCPGGVYTCEMDCTCHDHHDTFLTFIEVEE